MLHGRRDRQVPVAARHCRRTWTKNGGRFPLGNEVL
jgi:hypothetical protein